jgi:hypothetical protein
MQYFYVAMHGGSHFPFAFSPSSTKRRMASGLVETSTCLRRHSELFLDDGQAASTGGLVELSYQLRVGLTLGPGRSLMHGVAPQMCGRVASPLLGRGAGGRSPGYRLPSQWFPASIPVASWHFTRH